MNIPRTTYLLLSTAVVSLLAGGTTEAKEIYSRHFIGGLPRGAAESGDLIFRDIYVLHSNDDTKFADWVCYELTPHEVFGDLDLERDWRVDTVLAPDERLEPDIRGENDDFTGAYGKHRYDRGHLCPLGSFRGSRFASQVNYYSNIVPQKVGLNRGNWKQLEDAVRALVREHSRINVMAGPYYDEDADPMPPLPRADEEHRVPHGFWKIVARREESTIRVVAFVMPQVSENDPDLIETVKSVDRVEAMTGLDFFHELDDKRERALEGTHNKGWVRGWPE